MSPEMTNLINTALIVGLLSMFCSLCEASVVALSDFKVRTLRKTNERLANSLSLILKHKAKYISAIIMMNTFVNIGGSLYVGALSAQFLSEGDSRAFAIYMALGMLLFSEIKPKIYAASNPESVLKVINYPLKGMTFLLTPVANAINGLLGNNQMEEKMSIAELEQFICSASETGVIHDEEAKLLTNVVDLRAKSADCIAHTENVTKVGIAEIIDDHRDFLIEAKHRRILLVNDDGNVLGVFFREDALAAILKGEGGKAFASLMHHIPVLSSCIPLADLALKLERSPAHLAAIMDENGELSGVVGLSDIQGLVFSV